MIKSFVELYDTDLSTHISKKPVFTYDRDRGKAVKTGETLDYLNWADVVVLLHQNGAEHVRFGNNYNGDGHSLFLSLNNLPEVQVYVEIDGDRREITYPLIDGSKDIKMDKIAQSDVHNASQRAMVKCVAVNWGLGLKLWQKEERSAPVTPPSVDTTENVLERLRRKANTAVKKAGSKDELRRITGKSEADVKKLLAQCQMIAEFEKLLDDVLDGKIIDD